MINKGDIVKFKSEFQQNGEENLIFKAIENEYNNKVKIENSLDDNLFRPIELIPTYMLQ